MLLHSIFNKVVVIVIILATSQNATRQSDNGASHAVPTLKDVHSTHVTLLPLYFLLGFCAFGKEDREDRQTSGLNERRNDK